jgi:hypothetical protein
VTVLVVNLSLVLGIVLLVGIRGLILSISARLRRSDYKRQSPLERRARALAVLGDLTQRPRAAAIPTRHETAYGGVRIFDPESIPPNLHILRTHRPRRSSLGADRIAICRQALESRPTIAYLPTRPNRDHPATPDVA